MSDFKDRLREAYNESQPPAPEYIAPSRRDESWARAFYRKIQHSMERLARRGIKGAPICVIPQGNDHLVSSNCTGVHPDNICNSFAVYGRALALLQLIREDGMAVGIYGFSPHDFDLMGYGDATKRRVLCSITGSELLLQNDYHHYSGTAYVIHVQLV